MEFLLSHNNPCFRCDIAITNFLVSHTCEIRFHDVIGRSTVYMYFNAKVPKHCGQLFLYIQFPEILCVLKNLKFVYCSNKILLSSLVNVFQDWFNKILFQYLTHDRSYMSQILGSHVAQW